MLLCEQQSAAQLLRAADASPRIAPVKETQAL